jgi:hypothetical protein
LRDAADAVLSTAGMCRYVPRAARAAFIIGTEVGILHRSGTKTPAKRSTPAGAGRLPQHEKDHPGESALVASRHADRHHGARARCTPRQGAIEAMLAVH